MYFFEVRQQPHPMRNTVFKYRTILCMLCCLFALAPAARAGDLLVFAAASLKNAFDELAHHHEERTGDVVTISYAGSSVLARQIMAGAPADLFVSANPQWMDELEKTGDIPQGSRQDLVANKLLLVGAPGITGPVRDIDDLLSLLGDGRLAVGLLGAVPAGIYAQQAFEQLGWLDHIQPKLAQADNVRNVLALVVRGEAKMGVIYKSDLLAGPGLAVLKEFSGDSHDPIIYPAALTKKAGPKAEGFLEFLMSEDGQQILAKHGFQPIGQDR